MLSTCNRTEVYAECLTFHGALADITDALAEVTGVAARRAAAEHLYVHYEDARHRARLHRGLRPGLDGRRRGADPRPDARALASAQRRGHVGPALNALFQQALRVGKRAHTETGIDLVSVSLVEAGLARAEAELGPLGALSRARRRGRRHGRARRDHRGAGRCAHRRRRQPQPRRARSWPSGSVARPCRCRGLTRPSPAPTSSSRRTGAPGPGRRLPTTSATALAARDGRGRSTSTWPCRTTSTRRSPTCPG